MTDDQADTAAEPESVTPETTKTLLANPWLRGLAALLILGIVVLVSLPYGISFGLEKWFRSVGATDVEVGDIDFNPFTGRLQVKNLNVIGERGGNIRMQSARFQFAWLPLWKKHFLLESIALEDGEMRIKREPEGGWVVGVVALTGADEDEHAGEPTEWKVGLKQIEVSNTRFTVALPEFQSHFQINRASIDRAVAWEPEIPATVKLDFALDGAPLVLDGKVYPFREIPEAEGHLKAEAVGIERYRALLEPAVTGLTGSASVDAEFRVVAGETFTVSNKGDLQVDGLTLAGEGFDVAQETFSWKGSIDASFGQGVQRLDGDGSFEIAGVAIKLPDQTIHQEQLSYEGPFSVVLSPDASLPTVSTEGNIAAGQLSLSLAKTGVELRQGAMSWEGKIDFAEAAGVLSVTGDGKLEASAIDLQLPGQSVKERKVTWQGVASVALAADPAGSRVAAEGTLVSNDFGLGIEDSALQLQQTGMNWDGKITVSGLGDITEVAANGSIRAGETQLDNPEVSIRQSDTNWKGQVFFKQGVPGDQSITATGSLGLGAADTRLKGQQLRIVHDRANWDGQFGGDGANGNLKMAGFSVSNLQNEMVIAAADQMSLEGVKAPGIESLDIGQIQVGGFVTGLPKGADAGLAGATGIAISGLQWRSAGSTAIDSVTIDGLQASLVRSADGRFTGVDALLEATGGGDTAAPTDADAPTPDAGPGDTGGSSAVAVGKVSITGDSRLQFADSSVEPAAGFEIAIDEAELGAFDTQQPAQSTPVKFAGRLSNRSRISAEGQVKPFAKPFEADLSGKISNLAVQSLSPYAAETIGYQLTKGRMTATMTFKTEGGKIKGDNLLIFNELKVQAVSGEEKKLTVPLETGLAMLRDRDDRIKLKVPVSGDLDSPDFSVADAINQALLKATQKAAVGYLALTLQPWGAVLLAADLAKDLGPGATASLDPVTFNPGSADLKPEFTEYLGKLAKILDERPGVQLRLCGRAVKADTVKIESPPPQPVKEESRWKKLLGIEKEKAVEVPASPAPDESSLTALAESRSSVVLNALVEKHKVPVERIYTCDSTPNPDDEGEPRVDVGI
ncbi:MAG: DUF748 domain-containing protein [Sedimenticolaceae bacterium]